MKPLIIFDFDGTLTDAEKEGSPFKNGYLEDLSTLTNVPLDELI
jgi:phosphoglycolate phosphatase-like HAD superfamily hydrolase